MVAFRRSDNANRVNSAVLSVIIVLFPLIAAFSIWAFTGWVVSGEAFATLTSQYGNGSQVAAAVERSGPNVKAASDDWVVIAARMLGMQPFVGLAAAGAVVLAVLSRKADALVPVFTFGPILAFAAWGQYSSTTFGWFRFYLLAVPLVICVALACWEPLAAAARTTREWWRADSVPSRVGAGLLCASLTIGLPVTVLAMSNPRIGNQQLQYGLKSLVYPEDYPPSEQWYRRLMVNDRSLAQYFDQ